MFCIKCGAELPEGSAFCPACGAKVETETKAETWNEVDTGSETVTPTTTQNSGGSYSGYYDGSAVSEPEKKTGPKLTFFNMAADILLTIFVSPWYYVWVVLKTDELNGMKDYGYEDRNEIVQLLLCIFVPFYELYWNYQTAKRIQALSERYGIQMSNGDVIVDTLITMYGAITMQYRMNQLAELQQGITESSNYGKHHIEKIIGILYAVFIAINLVIVIAVSAFSIRNASMLQESENLESELYGVYGDEYVYDYDDYSDMYGDSDLSEEDFNAIFGDGETLIIGGTVFELVR